jgi:hypothetical protein
MAAPLPDNLEVVKTTIGDLLALLPKRELDYDDRATQVALDYEAERRLRLRGLLSPTACASLRNRIAKKAIRS